MRHLHRRLALLVALFLLAGTAAAAVAAKAKKPPKPKERYHFRTMAVERGAGLDTAAVDAPAVAILAELIGTRPDDFVTTVEGAPDPKADPEGFKKWAAKKKLRAFDVRIKFVKYERSLKPIEGTKDQELKVLVELEVLGATVPGEQLAFSGHGKAEVIAQVGKKVPPKMDSGVHHDALVGALSQALEEAVKELRAPPPAKPAKR